MKFYTLIAVMASATLSISYFFPPLLALLVILIGLSLTKRQALLYALIVGFVSYVLTTQIITLTNVFFLPLIIFILKQFETFIFGGKLSDGCLSKPNKFRNLRLASMSFILVFLANMSSEIIYGLTIGDVFSQILLGFLISFIGALITSVIVFLVGIPLLKRLNKLYLKME